MSYMTKSSHYIKKEGLLMTDMHTHTYFSDGDLDQSPDTLCKQAVESGIKYLSITDHDYAFSNKQLNELRSKHDIDLIPGCEFSCIWNHDGKKVIVHLGGHWLDEHDESIRQILHHNQNLNYEAYVKGMLHRYKKHHPHPALTDVDEAYEKIKEAHPYSHHLGKRAVAQFLLSEGCAANRQEAYDAFAYGGEAHVSSTEILHYVPFEEVVSAVTKKSLCTLNHLFYYHLNTEENHALMRAFKALGGQALETVYSHYDIFRQAALLEMCRRYDFLPNCGSDRHDVSRDFLQGPEVLFQQLKERQLQQYGTLHQ